MLAKKTSKKKVAPAPTETVVFEQNHLTICRNWEGNYSFDMSKKLCSTDVMEAVAYLMKQPQFNESPLWNLPINTDAEISTVKALYWLSGGDDFWKNPMYNANWVAAFPLLLSAFHERILDVYAGKNLREVRTNIARHLNLDVFYEFALGNGII